MTANELVDVIRYKSDQKEIDDAHEELENIIHNLDRETLETLCIRMVYSIDAFTTDDLD